MPQPGAGGSTITIEYKEYGVHLSFLPIVMGDGRIRLKAAPEVSELDYSKAVTISGTSVPGLTERKLQTTVELSEGQTFALAGLLQEEQYQRQQVGDTDPRRSSSARAALPRSVQYQHGNETELVVLVTPYLAGGLNPDQIPASSRRALAALSDRGRSVPQPGPGRTDFTTNDRPAKAISTGPVALTSSTGKHGFARPIAQTDTSEAK